MPKPVPLVEDHDRGFWEAVNQKRLVVQNCKACNRMQMPPQAACGKCSSKDNLEWKPVEGKGRINGYCVVHDTRVVPMKPDQPFNLAVIELAENPEIKFLSNLPGTPAGKVPVGSNVKVVFQEVEPGISLVPEWEARMTITTQTGWMRNKLGAGVWENRGKVAVAGVGQSPIDRRWKSGDLETSLGAYSVLAAKRALEDAGVPVSQVDGIVSAPGPIGDNWGPRPYFAAPYDSEDGLTKVTGEWLARGLGIDPANLKFCGNEPAYIGLAWGYAIEAIATGKCSTVLLLYPTGNVEGRYHQQTETRVKGPTKWTNLYGWTGGATYAYQYNEYIRKYGGTREDLAALVVNLRKNGLLVPWGYYTVNQPKPFTREEYLAGRFINEPMNLYDNDLPVNSAGCYLLTTSDRARDMKQKPIYIWNHAEHLATLRSYVQTLEEAELWCDQSAKKTLEGSGLSIKDIDIFNPYDGFTQFAQHWLEAFGWHGVKKGEALKFYNDNIDVHGPHPFLSSGGNNGTGRTRTAIYTDTIEQLRGTAGKRQVKIKAETGIAGCVLPQTNGHVVFGRERP